MVKMNLNKRIDTIRGYFLFDSDDKHPSFWECLEIERDGFENLSREEQIEVTKKLIDSFRNVTANGIVTLKMAPRETFFALNEMILDWFIFAGEAVRALDEICRHFGIAPECELHQMAKQVED